MVSRMLAACAGQWGQFLGGLPQCWVRVSSWCSQTAFEAGVFLTQPRGQIFFVLHTIDRILTASAHLADIATSPCALRGKIKKANLGVPRIEGWFTLVEGGLDEVYVAQKF